MTNYTAARMRRSLEFFAVPAPSHNDEIPPLPEDVTEIDDPGLMVLYRKIVAWGEYADQIFADASAMEKRAEQDAERTEAEQTATSSQKTVAAKRAEASLNKKVQDAQNDVLLAYHNRKRAEAAVKLVDRRLAFVSREITRRSAVTRGRGA